jgi:hypothetical protein
MEAFLYQSFVRGCIEEAGAETGAEYILGTIIMG